MKIEELLEEGVLSKSLKVSRQMFLEWRHQGLPYLKLGSRVFYAESDFLDWIFKNKEKVWDPETDNIKRKSNKAKPPIKQGLDG